ncbi:MAG: hypothetical protein J6M53_00215 [Bacteroidaceae bacterium]|nr:hypothetical protein [Bacteroidaceae bacterium]
MKHLFYIFVTLLAVGLASCGGGKTQETSGGDDTLPAAVDEETQRFLSEEGDIVRDGDTTDYSRVPDDLPDEEDIEANLPPIEE